MGPYTCIHHYHPLSTHMVDLEWPHWIQPYDVWVGHPPKLPLDRLLLLCGILWLSAGARFIRRQIGNALSRMFIFMDDRTFTSRTADGLVRITDAWKDWSDRVGLIENVSKTQFAARVQTQRT